MSHKIKVKKHRFDNKPYHIFWKKPYRCEGICSAPDHPARDRRILINPQGDSKTLMDTIIHESIHAEQWYLDEETVTRISVDLTDFLWKCGYRLTDGNDKVINYLKKPAIVSSKRLAGDRRPKPSLPNSQGQCVG